MKPSLLILTAVAALAAAVSGSSRLLAASSSPSSAAATPRQVVLYGHIKSLTHKGHRFEMRFDPALLLTGFTAQRAKLEDTGSSEVPNDYYIVDETHRLLTYLVPATAHVSILTRHGRGPLGETPSSVSELAKIVLGKNPKHRQLLEPKAGFWIRIGNKYPNPVLALDQQYQP
jgi:hypothetical protein